MLSFAPIMPKYPPFHHHFPFFNHMMPIDLTVTDNDLWWMEKWSPLMNDKMISTDRYEDFQNHIPKLNIKKHIFPRITWIMFSYKHSVLLNKNEIVGLQQASLKQSARDGDLRMILKGEINTLGILKEIHYGGDALMKQEKILSVWIFTPLLVCMKFIVQLSVDKKPWKKGILGHRGRRQVNRRDKEGLDKVIVYKSGEIRYKGRWRWINIWRTSENHLIWQ